MLLARSSSRGTGTGAGGGPDSIGAAAASSSVDNGAADYRPRVSSPLSPPRMRRRRSSSRGDTPAGRRLFSFGSSSSSSLLSTDDDDNDAGDVDAERPLVTVQVEMPAVAGGTSSSVAARFLRTTWRTVAILARLALAVAVVALVYGAVWSPAEQNAWRSAWERERAEERARAAALDRMWCFLAFALPGGGAGGIMPPALGACG